MKKLIPGKPSSNITQDVLVIMEVSPSHCSLREEESKEEIVQNICDNRSNISAISFKANGKETRYVGSKGKHHVFRDGDPNQKENKGEHNKTVAVTRVFFIITVVYCCSFFPHVAHNIAAFLNEEFIPNLSFKGTVAYQMFRWSFLINNIANPIIYIIYDRKLMGEVRMFCRSCLGICRKIQRRDDNAA
jgi:hypothetical protein